MTAITARHVRPPRLRITSSSLPVWVVLALAFGVAWLVVDGSGGAFLTPANLQDIAIRAVALGLVAVGQALVVLAGSLDLSVAYTVSIAAVTVSLTMGPGPAGMVLGVAAGLGVGAAIGLLNGAVIVGLRLNALIATFAVALVARGALNAMFDNVTGAVPPAFRALGHHAVANVPVGALLLAGVVAGAWFLMHRTRFGYHVYAVGGDADLARLSGIRTGRVLIGVHLLCGACAALSGIFLASRLGGGAPWVGPQGGYDLDSVAAVVLGGVALAGGRGRLLGTIGAVLLFAVFDSVFHHFAADPFLRTLVRGIVIVGAVALYARRGRERA